MTISIERRIGAPDGVELVEWNEEENRWVSRGGETVVCPDGVHEFGVRQDGVVLEHGVTSIHGYPDGEGGLVKPWPGELITKVPAGEEIDLEYAQLTIRTW